MFSCRIIGLKSISEINFGCDVGVKVDFLEENGDNLEEKGDFRVLAGLNGEGLPNFVFGLGFVLKFE